MAIAPSQFVRELTRRHRVIVLGGLAVIAHGLSRSTKDVDLWIEPMESAETWAQVVIDVVQSFPGLSIHTLPGWKQVSGGEVADAASFPGIIRILGLECPLDLFRKPNEFEADHFDEVWKHSLAYDDGARIPHPLELVVTKLNTGRKQDQMDRDYLESLILEEYQSKLPTACLEEAKNLFDRFVDWRTCLSAISNPDPEVQKLARDYLKEMANEGDPFSQAILEGREIP